MGLFALGVVLTLFMINWERKVVARMQQRPGPNRVGPKGWLQSLADGLKLAFKEDIMPVAADKKVYFIARYGSAGTSASRRPAVGRAREPLRPEIFGQAVLATWRQLLDESSLAVDEPALAGTARPAQLRLQRGHGRAAGPGGRRAGDGAHRARHDHAAGGDRGPAGRRRVAAGELPGSRVRGTLGVGHGDLVGVSA